MPYKSRSELIEEANSLGLDVPEKATRDTLKDMISKAENETASGPTCSNHAGRPAVWESVTPRVSKIYYCDECYNRYGSEPMVKTGWTAQQDRLKAKKSSEEKVSSTDETKVNADDPFEGQTDEAPSENETDEDE